MERHVHRPRVGNTTWLVLLLVGVFAGGCAGQRARTLEDPHEDSVATTQASATAVLAAGDRVRITISDFVGPGEPWKEQYRLAADGTMPIPYVGNVKLAGMTPEEAERAILQSLQDANACCFYVPTIEVRRD